MKTTVILEAVLRKEIKVEAKTADEAFEKIAKDYENGKIAIDMSYHDLTILKNEMGTVVAGWKVGRTNEQR